MAKVRGSQEQKPLEVEYGKTTVYVRKNIQRVEEPDTDERRGFSGWEYDEVSYTYPEWNAKQNLDIMQAIAELATIVVGGQG